MSAPIRVLIVDDHLVVREGLRLMLETSDEFTIVDSVADGEAAVRAAERVRPDVVLMDLRLPGIDGAAATQAILTARPATGIVILTTYDEDRLGLAAIASGARGYLRKDCTLATLHRTIREVARGRTTVEPELRARSRCDRPVRLTEREIDVLRHVAAGARNAQIAAGLGITERTVRAHLSSIFTKLDAESRMSAVARARENGLLR